jgi:hypothetical protein
MTEEELLKLISEIEEKIRIGLLRNRKKFYNILGPCDLMSTIDEVIAVATRIAVFEKGNKDD